LKRTGFSDTAFFYALADIRDKWHQACVEVFHFLRQGGWQLVTTLLVISETHALILQRVGRDKAFEFLRWVWNAVEIVPVEPEDLNRALEILERYSDKDFSLTDAISFAVMERLGISVALSVDRHFVEYGGSFFVAPLMGAKVPE